MKLQGPRLTIRPMQQSDVDAMTRWRPFADPLYRPFDFPRQSSAEHLRWFEWRSKDPSRRLYAILDEGCRVIGSLTLRDINGKQSARLGITIGADFVSQGYGTEALELFLDHFFGVMDFARMVLDVAATNLRAVRCYRSMGFQESGQHYRPASDPSYRILQQEPHYRHLLRFFRRQAMATQVLFYDMTLTRELWRSLATSDTHPNPSCSGQFDPDQNPR